MGEIASDPNCPYCTFGAVAFGSGLLYRDDLCWIVMCPDCHVPYVAYNWHGEPDQNQIVRMFTLLRKRGMNEIETTGRITVERSWGHWRAHLREVKDQLERDNKSGGEEGRVVSRTL